MNGIIILAAGASRRLGYPKQLLEIEDENLLNRMIRMARDSNFEVVSVVVGAHIELIIPQIDTTGIHLFLNPDWESGMSSTLACGLKYTLRAHPGLQSVLILLVDQPHVTTELINSFLKKYQEEAPPIVAARYDDTFGVPALFDQKLFPKLLDLKGSSGARQLIRSHKKKLIAVDFPEGKMDVDTPEDWEKIKTQRYRR